MNQLVVLSWAILIGAALLVIMSKGLFAPVAYHIDLYGGEHDYGPALFSMGMLPLVFAFAQYVMKKLETDKDKIRIGIMFCAVILPIVQISLAYVALSD